MALEIERKFLVHKEKLPKDLEGKRYVQGYLRHEKSCVVRVRIIEDKAFLTIKGQQEGISRAEFEYEVPVEDARGMLELASQAPIEKIRYLQHYQGHLWEIDVFEGVNNGLIVAEIELSSETESFVKPEWLSTEVSHDMRYTNASLNLNPYTSW